MEDTSHNERELFDTNVMQCELVNTYIKVEDFYCKRLFTIDVPFQFSLIPLNISYEANGGKGNAEGSFLIFPLFFYP